MQCRKVISAVLGPLLLVGLAGCNRPPAYHPPQYALAPSWSGTGVFRVATPQDGALRADWWTLFQDPLLNQLEQRAAKSNPDLKAASEAFLQARYLTVKAESGLFPQVGLDAGASADQESQNTLFRSPYNPIDDTDAHYGAMASWEPDLWSRIRNTTRMRKQNAQQAAADLALVRLSIQAELASDYMRLRGYDVEDRIYRQTILSYQRAVKITTLRVKGALSPGSDLTRSEAQLHSTQAAETELLLHRALEEHAIAILLNESPNGFHIAPMGAFPTALPEVPTGIPSQLLQRRPDIAAAERRMAAANTAIGIAKSAFYPNITLSAFAGFADNGFGLANLADSLWSYGLETTLPVFEGGRRRAEMQRAYSAYRETTDEYRSTVLSAFREVTDSLSREQQLQLEEQQLQAAVEAATKTQKMSMALYTGDLTNYLDVVTAQIAALEARLAEVEVQMRRYQNTVSLIRSLGGGWSNTELPTMRSIAPMKVTQYSHLATPSAVQPQDASR